jgi:hypothetical protein
MFANLRQAKYLKACSQDGAAVAELAGRAQPIGRVHHFGEIDAENPGGRATTARPGRCWTSRKPTRTL